MALLGARGEGAIDVVEALLQRRGLAVEQRERGAIGVDLGGRRRTGERLARPLAIAGEQGRHGEAVPVPGLLELELELELAIGGKGLAAGAALGVLRSVAVDAGIAEPDGERPGRAERAVERRDCGGIRGRRPMQEDHDDGSRGGDGADTADPCGAPRRQGGAPRRRGGAPGGEVVEGVSGADSAGRRGGGG